MARTYVTTIEDVMGSNGVAAILRLAELGHLIGNYPPDNLDREFSFEDFSAINQAIEDMYGPQGAKGLCLRAGRATFNYVVKDTGLMVSPSDPAFGLLPLGAKVKVVVSNMAQTFTELSDQLADVEEDEKDLTLAIRKCAECWGRTSDVPVCYGVRGMVEEGLRWVSDDRDFRVVEATCVAKGDDACRFVIAREPAE